MSGLPAPYSQEAEEAVIGAVLTSPRFYLNIASFLKPDDFFFLRHNYIWAAIGRLEARHDPVDIVTVSEDLQAHNQLVEVGGPAFLTQLIRSIPTSQHAEVYGGMVKYAAKRRQVMTACEEIKVSMLDETISFKQASEAAESKLLAVTAMDRHQDDTDISSITHEYVDSVEQMMEMRKQGIMPGLLTGYPDVDNITGGEYRGELLIVAGPAKSGKSTLTLNVARNRLKQGASIAIYIAEMNRQAVVRKFVSMETGIPMRVLKNGTFNAQQWSQFVEASSKISKWKLHIIDEWKSPTPLDIRRSLRQIMHEESLDAVLVDGLWRMHSDRQAATRSLEIIQVMNDMIDITAKFNLRLSMVHQMNRAPGTRRNPRPILSDLGESIGVEQNASTVIFLYRENYYGEEDADNNEMEVIVKATRDGDTGVAKLGWNKDRELYYDLGTADKEQQRFTQKPAPVNDNRKDVYQ